MGELEMLSGPVTTHPDAPSPGMPSAGRRPHGRGRDGQGHLPSFQATRRASQGNIKPWAQDTAAHGLCPTAGPLDPGVTSPGGLGSISGGLELQHLHLVVLQPLSPFQVQTNKDGGLGGNLDRLATVGHDSALSPLSLCQQEKVV